MINNAASYSSIIHALKEVDGETMQYILEQVGMDKQMLRQLVMTSQAETLEDLLQERQEIYCEELDSTETKITRLEVINHTKNDYPVGRILTLYKELNHFNSIELSFQDGGKTLKVFLD